MGTGAFLLVRDRLTFNITYSGLSDPAVGAHIHGPAAAEETAGVMIDLEPFNAGSFDASGSFSGSVELNPEQLQAALDGLVYVNIHTDDKVTGLL